MRSRILGHVLNYYTGKELPVVDAKVVDTRKNSTDQTFTVTFVTSSHAVVGTFALNDSVQKALYIGAQIPAAIGFVQPFMSALGTQPTPVVMMVGLRPDAIDDVDGIVVYSMEAREAD